MESVIFLTVVIIKPLFTRRPPPPTSSSSSSVGTKSQSSCCPLDPFRHLPTYVHVMDICFSVASHPRKGATARILFMLLTSLAVHHHQRRRVMMMMMTQWDQLKYFLMSFPNFQFNYEPWHGRYLCP